MYNGDHPNWTQPLMRMIHDHFKRTPTNGVWRDHSGACPTTTIMSRPPPFPHDQNALVRDWSRSGLVVLASCRFYRCFRAPLEIVFYF